LRKRDKAISKIPRVSQPIPIASLFRRRRIRHRLHVFRAIDSNNLSIGIAARKRDRQLIRISGNFTHRRQLGG
jgi:hypothetical protein